MNREIKFRGKRADTLEWVYGYYGWSMGKHYITTIVNESPTWGDPGGCYIENSHDVIPETVGQFTGLFDVENNDIYEDDILSENGINRQVVFSEGSFGVINIQQDGSRSFGSYQINKGIVTGNIHDQSPETNKQP